MPEIEQTFTLPIFVLFFSVLFIFLSVIKTTLDEWLILFLMSVLCQFSLMLITHVYFYINR
jgi:hypothetical protein